MTAAPRYARPGVKIVVVTTSWPKHEDDPAGHFVRTEVRALEARGDEVVVVAPRDGARAFGWPGAAARVRERPWLATHAARELVSMSARARRAARSADRVIAHWAVPCALLADAHEVVSHGADVRLLRALPGLARRAVVLRVLRYADAWRFPSEALLADLLASLDDDAAKRVRGIARVVAPPFEVPARSQLPDVAVEPRGHGATWVSVARLVPGKRVDRAITEAARAHASLVVVGDGPERARLEAHARRTGADVRFVGAVGRREALAWIAAADALVHASEAEGLSTVVREAHALGTRVVSVR